MYIKWHYLRVFSHFFFLLTCKIVWLATLLSGWHELTAIRWYLSFLSKNREIMCELCSSLGTKGMVHRGVKHSINNWKRNSGFEYVIILQVTGNKYKAKKLCYTQFMKVGKQIITIFARKELKWQIIITTTMSIYSSLIWRTTMSTAW